MLPAIAPVLAWLLTITCPGGTGCVGPDYPLPAGVTQDLRLKVDGTVIGASGATLQSSQVICLGLAERDGIRAQDVSGFRLVNVDVSGACGRGGNAGIRWERCTNCELWESKVRSSDGFGMLVTNSPNAKIMGLFTNAAKLDGLRILNSPGFIVTSSLWYVGTGSDVYGARADSSSPGTIARSRSRYNSGELSYETGTSETGTICETPLNAATCQPQSIPRYWLVCTNHTYPTGAESCHFVMPQEAVDSPLVQPGDTILIDTPVNPPYPPLLVNKAGLTIKSATCGGNLGGHPQGGGQQGSFAYYEGFESIIVTAPGITLSGMYSILPPQLQSDTIYYEVAP